MIMMITTAFVLLLCLLTGQTSASSLTLRKRGLEIFVPSTVCYDEIGCFSTGGNFYNPLIRPVQFLPWSPEKLQPGFWLYTRANLYDKSEIRYKDRTSVTSSSYDPKKPTKFICHGWTDSTDSAWMTDMMKALLSFGDFNVILVDWRIGSRALYGQSTSNTRVIGALIARLVIWLEKEFNANREDFHVIGHSLGGQVAGYAGERLRESESKQLGRITGLDPAGPYFENTHPEVRLDPTDARFVDAIHTDAPAGAIGTFVGLGMAQPVGHVDFYPNSGSSQPGCPRGVIPTFQDIILKGIVGATSNSISCDHLRVPVLFTATAANPSTDFQAYECNSYGDFKSGKCLSCVGNRCAQLGIRANEWNPSGRTNVKMYSDTQASDPFYMHHYAVTVRLGSGFGHQTGDLTVTLSSDNGRSTSAATVVSGGGMDPGQVFQTLVTSSEAVLGVTQVSIYWKSNAWWNIFNIFGSPKIAIDRVQVLEGANQRISTFCDNGGTIDSGSSRTLNSC